MLQSSTISSASCLYPAGVRWTLSLCVKVRILRAFSVSESCVAVKMPRTSVTLKCDAFESTSDIFCSQHVTKVTVKFAC